jgi:hypothetical protein
MRDLFDESFRPCKRRCLEVDQGGEGFFQNLRSLFTKGKQLAFGPVGTALSNLLPSSDPTARPLFAGEKHTLLKLPNEKFGRANFMGPGTHLVARLKRGDPPRTFADKESQAHDSRYALAKTAAEVRRADTKYIEVMRRAKKHRLDFDWNTNQGIGLISAKMKIENVTGQPFTAFGEIADSERPLVQAKLTELEKQGFGHSKGPAHRLKKR